MAAGESRASLAAGQTVRVPPLGLETAAPAPARRLRPRDDTAGHQATAKLLADAVLYRDEAVLVINKPAGLPVQGGSGSPLHVDGALDGLRFGHAERPRLVHRLDKDTSGALVLARDAAAARWLTAAFRGQDAQNSIGRWSLASRSRARDRSTCRWPNGQAAPAKK